MKKIKVGKKEFEIVSNIGEIRYDKFVMFNQYIIAVFQGIDVPMFQLFMDKIRNHYNKAEYMQAYNEIVNYDTALKFREHKLDPLGICFALMLKGDETDEGVLKDKLKELIDNGLKWDMVKEEVVLFMKLYPSKFSPYLQAWQMMEAGIEV